MKDDTENANKTAGIIFTFPASSVASDGFWQGVNREFYAHRIGGRGDSGGGAVVASDMVVKVGQVCVINGFIRELLEWDCLCHPGRCG